MNFMLDENLKVSSLPKGFIKFAIPTEIWRQKFSIRFSVMNAIVSKHFSQLTLRDVMCQKIENTPGFIRYMISYAGVGNLGEVYIQELSHQSTLLSIKHPPDDEPIGWNQEQRYLIESQPDRDSKIKMMYELAHLRAAQYEKIQKWQELIFVVFLKHLLSDPHIVESQKMFYEHFEDFAEYTRSEMRMEFWQYDEQKKPKWVSKPEQLAKNYLRFFLNGRFEDSIYEFEEIRAGAGYIDILIIAPNNDKVVVELKMCGHNYSSGYAQGGMKQLLHYMKNKETDTGFLIIFDSRTRDFAKGFQRGEQIIDGKSIFIVIVDVRPQVKSK